jgi:hypothetical protein
MIRIKPSERNTNKHTEQGMELLQKSIEKVGVIESISVADDGTIISGHARKEVFDKKGMRAKEIELDDDEFAVLKTKIKANSKEYYEAQILANTTGHKNYNLDIEEIEIIAEEYGIDIQEIGVEGEEFIQEPYADELIGEEKNKPATMKITFESPEQLQKAEIDIQELLDRKYQGAYFSVSAGEL